MVPAPPCAPGSLPAALKPSRLPGAPSRPSGGQSPTAPGKGVAEHTANPNQSAPHGPNPRWAWVLQELKLRRGLWRSACRSVSCASHRVAQAGTGDHLPNFRLSPQAATPRRGEGGEEVRWRWREKGTAGAGDVGRGGAAGEETVPPDPVPLPSPPPPSALPTTNRSSR